LHEKLSKLSPSIAAGYYRVPERNGEPPRHNMEWARAEAIQAFDE
jgi:hypothetical protein